MCACMHVLCVCVCEREGQTERKTELVIACVNLCLCVFRMCAYICVYKEKKTGAEINREYL